MDAINTGDTAFILIASALVMFMTPGLALFYGGMVRSKNVLGTIMHSFIILGLVTIEWVLWGYSTCLRPRPGRHHRQPGLVRAFRGRDCPF